MLLVSEYHYTSCVGVKIYYIFCSYILNKEIKLILLFHLLR